MRDARETLADLQVLAGVVPVAGPGISISIEDPAAEVEWDAMLDLIQELRDAGAEAIAVDDTRVLASTWFGPTTSGVSVSGRLLRAPYSIAAIGPAEELAEAIQLPGGPLTVIGARPEVEVRVRTEGDLVLPAAEETPAFEHARSAS